MYSFFISKLIHFSWFLSFFVTLLICLTRLKHTRAYSEHIFLSLTDTTVFIDLINTVSYRSNRKNVIISLSDNAYRNLKKNIRAPNLNFYSDFDFIIWEWNYRIFSIWICMIQSVSRGWTCKIELPMAKFCISLIDI